MPAKVENNKGEYLDDEARQTAEWDTLSWQPVVEDEGYKVELVLDKPIYLLFEEAKKVQQANPDTGLPEEVILFKFRDLAGKTCHLWQNYRLLEALDKGMTPGCKVKIVQHGKVDIGNGRSMNRLSVYVA